MRVFTPGKVSAALWLALTAASLSGCGTLESFIPSGVLDTAPVRRVGEAPAGSPGLDKHGHPLPGPGAPLTEADKMVVTPLGAADMICPDVQVREGGAASRSGGPSNETVRYQFQIDDTARECQPIGDKKATIKVGVMGKLLIGPAGSAGTYSSDLRVAIRNEADQKIAFSKAYRVTVTTDASGVGSYQTVTEPIELPVISADIASQYSVFVGFGGNGDIVSKRAKAR